MHRTFCSFVFTFEHVYVLRWFTLLPFHYKVTTAPPGTQAASLDIERAYHNSPIAPIHKPYLAISWQENIYVGHVAVEGLATAGSIQGTPADALIDIFQHHGIEHVFKWVDDVVIFRVPVSPSRSALPAFSFDLKMVFRITAPLGVPWHPIEKKGQDFASSVKYVRFLWDLDHRRVSLPDKKCIKLLAKIDNFLALDSCTVSRRDCTSLHGSLQHITFIFREGRSTLPPISSFVLKFTNDFSWRHVPATVIDSVRWWNAVLLAPVGSRSLSPHRKVDPDVWVDASSSWGIGLVVGKHWAAWYLREGWKTGDRDIGWAESVALELAVLWLVTQDFADCEVAIKGDNTGVIGAFNKGRLRNVSRNATIRRMAASLVPLNITVLPVYVASAVNRADPVSHGTLGPQEFRLGCSFKLPPELSQYLSYV